MLALIDFTDAVVNSFKAQRMIKGSFKEKNEFNMVCGKSPYINDKALRHIGNKNDPFEIFLNTSFFIKQH